MGTARSITRSAIKKAPYATAGVGDPPLRPLDVLPHDLTDRWYNEVFSANSEQENLPFPVCPAARGIQDRCMGVRGAYKLSHSLAAGHAAVILYNKHAGPFYNFNQVELGANYAVTEADFLLLDYASQATPLTNSGSNWTVGGFLNGATDLINWGGSMSPTIIPPVNGVDPRDLLQPISRNGGYCSLGASMAVEVATTLNGQAVIAAADTNQNPRNMGDRHVSSTWFHPGPNLPGDGREIYPGVIPGNMVIPVPPGAMQGLAPCVQVPPNTGWTGNAMVSTQVPIPTVDGFFLTYNRTVVGGNSKAYAYAQIAGDQDCTPGSGLLQPDVEGINMMYASGEFPLASIGPTIFASGCLIYIANNSATDNLTINVTCTAAFVCPVDPTVPDYLTARPCPAHSVRSMSYLNTADVSSQSPIDAKRKVKTAMISRMAASTDTSIRSAASLQSLNYMISSGSGTSGTMTVRPGVEGTFSSVLRGLITAGQAGSRYLQHPAIRAGIGAGLSALKSLLGNTPGRVSGPIVEEIL